MIIFIIWDLQLNKEVLIPKFQITYVKDQDSYSPENGF